MFFFNFNDLPPWRQLLLSIFFIGLMALACFSVYEGGYNG
jgi:hypothetical protein